MIATSLLVDPPVGGRLVWAGRTTVAPDGAVDGWSCDQAGLLAMLDQASELVVLDALSFPWDSLRNSDRDVPVVVALPPECDAATLNVVLGQPLLRHLTPYDRLIDPRPDVRAVLQRRWGLAEENWLHVDGATPEAVLAALVERSNDRLVDITTDIGTFRTQIDDLITRQLTEWGAHERGSLNVLLALVEPDDVIIDVGAHIGTFAVPLAQRLGYGGHLVAIEGSRTNAALLAHNVAINGLEDRITVLERVLGRKGAPAVQARLTPGNTGAVSFEQAGWSTVGQVFRVPLDDLMAEVDQVHTASVLKVDVEGSELAVLEGAETLVDRDRPILMLEVSRDQLSRHGTSVERLDRWFADHDYRTFLISGPRHLRGADWEIVSLDRLADCEQPLFTVVAMPTDSPRMHDLTVGDTHG
jgi:FkbM family methyltransferase